MKVSGFTIVRNGVLFEYPFVESIRSLIPLVDEIVVNVGLGDDETLQVIQNLKSEFENRIPFHIIESKWPLDDPEKKKSGLILSEQTNIALDACSGELCFYLQADEVLHEEDYSGIQNAIKESALNPQVDGWVFDYVHFYGSYDYIQFSRSAYRREIRLIRKSCGARSVGDAQSFRKPGNMKLNCVHAHGQVFHYGWVRTPEAMKNKTFFMDQLYHGDPSQAQAEAQTPHTGDAYRYKRILGLYRFLGTHPKVMMDRVHAKNWNWDIQSSPLVWSFRDIKKIILDRFEKITGIRLFEYKSYRWIKKQL